MISQLLSLIDDHTCPSYHMEVDREAIEGGCSLERPSLRFYGWPSSGAFTLGRFLNSDELLRNRAIPHARRPTGGGLLLHGSFDLSFSLLVPSGTPFIEPIPRENYHKIHSIIREVIVSLTGQPEIETKIETKIQSFQPIYCMASQTPYDILFHGMKIGGSACRITKKGLLFQASLFLSQPHWEQFESALVNGSTVIEEMKQVSSTIEEVCCLPPHSLEKSLLREALIQKFTHAYSQGCE